VRVLWTVQEELAKLLLDGPFPEGNTPVWGKTMARTGIQARSLGHGSVGFKLQSGRTTEGRIILPPVRSGPGGSKDRKLDRMDRISRLRANTTRILLLEGFDPFSERDRRTRQVLLLLLILSILLSFQLHPILPGHLGGTTRHF